MLVTPFRYSYVYYIFIAESFTASCFYISSVESQSIVSSTARWLAGNENCVSPVAETRQSSPVLFSPSTFNENVCRSRDRVDPSARRRITIQQSQRVNFNKILCCRVNLPAGCTRVRALPSDLIKLFGSSCHRYPIGF